MTVERHGSGVEYEPVVGYSRVVRAGSHVWVSGCTAIMEGGVIAGPGDAFVQAQQALRNVEDALAQVGARLEDVVRTRVYVSDIANWEQAARAHGEVFRETKPACTGIVTELIDPRWLVEIEVEAILPS